MSNRFRPVVEEVDPIAPPPPVATPVVETEAPQSTQPPEPSGTPVAIQDNYPPPAIIASPKKSHLNLKMVILVTSLTAILVGVVAGAIYVYFSRSSVDLENENLPGENSQGSLSEPFPSLTPEPTATSTPTPVPVDLSSLSLNILNGSGKIGEASKVGDLLEEDGFTVKSTANASRYDYQETLIQAKSSVPESVVEDIISLLTNAGYEAKQGTKLDEASSFDLIITVGQSD